jgi:hypothetical protein
MIQGLNLNGTWFDPKTFVVPNITLTNSTTQNATAKNVTNVTKPEY